MRLALLPLLAFLAIAASPAEDARRLVDAGQEQEALDIVQRASADGDLEAMESLAWFYDNGRGVKQDQARAAALFRRAAEAGRAHSQWRLGVMHDTGEGVAVNPAEAVRWLRLSAAQDYPHAFTSLGVMYATGRGVPRDYAESRRNYERAARLGEAHGFYGLGVLHAEGQGVAADRMESLAYMMVAASMGDETANAAVRDANFQDAQMRAIIARANAIIADYGVDAPRIVLEGDEDEGQELVPVA